MHVLCIIWQIPLVKKKIHRVFEIQISIGIQYFHMQNLVTLSNPSSEWHGKAGAFYGICTSASQSSDLVCPQMLVGKARDAREAQPKYDLVDWLYKSYAQGQFSFQGSGQICRGSYFHSP